MLQPGTVMFEGQQSANGLATTGWAPVMQKLFVRREGVVVSPPPLGWGQVADCVQWLCYLVQLILAQW